MQLLPLPSAEQQHAIDAIKSGKCLTIPAVAGSGKTTTMLQIASKLPPHRRVTIVTYNRSLKDECRDRIVQCGLSHRVSCYTIHGLVSKVAKRICNDDHKLNQVVQLWDDEHANVKDYKKEDVMVLDLLMLDEAQDLRPSFYKALCHIIRMSQTHLNHHHGSNQNTTTCTNANEIVDKKRHRYNLQMCLVGDHKQMLYDFPTYGNDKATSRYIQQPHQHWGQFTNPRQWITTNLTTSYRLTPNIASFVNVIWGTSIRGGNTRVPNVPVEYICRYPYPPYTPNDDSTRLQTSVLSNIIDEHGADNVMFLAQSVRNEQCPIRVHVNALMKEKNAQGKQKYNFHIKESLRGFEGGSGSADVKNKVRVWTFCGSKGCEADCVVVFGLDMMTYGRVHSLNQVGVALSRAKKRLIVIHGMAYVERCLCTNPYYPMLGDDPKELEHVVACEGGNDYRYNVPPFPEELKVPPCPEELKKSGRETREQILNRRSKLTKRAIEHLVENGIICLKQNRGRLPTNEKAKSVIINGTVYVASDFNYFAASEEESFLAYGTWTKESGVTDRIEYTANVQFETTKEDVSALYGEALVYMLQWEREGFCPNIETVVNDGILRFEKFKYYGEQEVLKDFKKKNCEPLSPAHAKIFREKFARGKTRGNDLVHFLNSRFIKLQKKRVEGDQIIYFPVKAVVSVVDDEHMEPFQIQIKSIYKASGKSPTQWIYLANAVMAFGQYHDKWNQIGTNPSSYDSWVESNALIEALSRLSKLMQNIPVNNSETVTKQECSDKLGQGGEFERDVRFLFELPEKCIKGRNAQIEVAGVSGICDWIGQGLVSERGQVVDLLEIKFVHELSNVNRLQVLVYCALLSLETGRSCSGMLFNARTGELEICRIEIEKAARFLSDISQFKLSGARKEKNERQPNLHSVETKTSSESMISENGRRRKLVNSTQANSTRSEHATVDEKPNNCVVKVESGGGKKLRASDVAPKLPLPVRSSDIIDLTMDSSDEEDA